MLCSLGHLKMTSNIGFEMNPNSQHAIPQNDHAHDEEVENEEGEYVPERYHRLARIMSQDKNLAIFRRFDELNMIQLMAMQAEIIELQLLYETICQQDDKEETSYSGNFYDLRKQGLRKKASRNSSENRKSKREDAEGNNLSQYELLKTLRTVVSDYSKSNGVQNSIKWDHT